MHTWRSPPCPVFISCTGNSPPSSVAENLTDKIFYFYDISGGKKIVEEHNININISMLFKMTMPKQREARFNVCTVDQNIGGQNCF